jgi:hypothetical protein
MVIVGLMGGLGNQMFQYAAGRAVAHRNRTPLKLDISAFEQDPLRSYRLHHFNIVESIATPDEVARLTKRGRGLWNRISHRLERYLLPLYKQSVFAQRFDYFDPDILRVRGNVYLVGYWQSEKHFKDIEQIIRQDFTLRHAPDAGNQRLIRIMTNTNSVSLHIRRGDYVSNPVTYRYHGVCSLDHYRAAVARLTQTVKRPHFFIFSDDMEWAQQNLKLDYPVTYVTHNGVERDYADLRLMSQCKHHIIANSAFSWWGAWLCTYPPKIVIAPQKWFNKANCDTRDLTPASWIRL